MSPVNLVQSPVNAGSSIAYAGYICKNSMIVETFSFICNDILNIFVNIIQRRYYGIYIFVSCWITLNMKSIKIILLVVAS